MFGTLLEVMYVYQPEKLIFYWIYANQVQYIIIVQYSIKESSHYGTLGCSELFGFINIITEGFNPPDPLHSKTLLPGNYGAAFL